MCACKLGVCAINNNNRTKVKKPTKTKKSTKKNIVRESSSEWTDSESDSCSGCSDCFSSSSCYCSECDTETDSWDDSCWGSACGAQSKTKKKTTGKGKKVICRDGVCEWGSKKKTEKPTKTKSKTSKNGKNRKGKPTGKCYDCC